MQNMFEEDAILTEESTEMEGGQELMEDCGGLSPEMGEQSVELPSNVPMQTSVQPGNGFRPLGDAEALAFLRQYPGLDPREIPKSVWADVRRGVSLTDAYGRHERGQLQARNRELEQRLAVMQANERSRLLSVGSMKSYGRSVGYDDFMAGFDEA